MVQERLGLPRALALNLSGGLVGGASRRLHGARSTRAPKRVDGRGRWPRLGRRRWRPRSLPGHWCPWLRRGLSREAPRMTAMRTRRLGPGFVRSRSHGSVTCRRGRCGKGPQHPFGGADRPKSPTVADPPGCTSSSRQRPSLARRWPSPLPGRGSREEVPNCRPGWSVVSGPSWPGEDRRVVD
jgi:hypothetical protein